MLTRYARTQFVDPNLNDLQEPENKDKPFYGESEEDEAKDNKSDISTLDPDHRLLLRNTKPLLQSRNSSVQTRKKCNFPQIPVPYFFPKVVMAVAQLYHHLAPRSEVAIVGKALIRLLRSHREVQVVILNSIASMSVNRKVSKSLIVFQQF